jgi:hypothetical protein
MWGFAAQETRRRSEQRVDLANGTTTFSAAFD